MLIKADKITELNFPVDTDSSDKSCSLPCSDRLFENTSVFSKSSANTALALSLSAMNEQLLKDNLSRLGFSDIICISFDNTDKEKIGIALSCRQGGAYLEVAAVLKGSNGGEWYSNFDIGYSAEHHGFSKAADFADEVLSDYVFTRAIGCRPRFFITGYSRGGAVANILSKRLCDRHGEDRVSAYTFAAPSTTISRRTNRFSSIFNLVRDVDFFAKVPPEGWGYTKYGKTIRLKTAENFDDKFKELVGREYIGFSDTRAIDSFICAAMRLCPNVLSYYHRRRDVGEYRLSLYEFMCKIADIPAHNTDDSAADIFLSAMVSEYADILSFMSSGADLYELIDSAQAVPRCSIADSHHPASYLIDASFVS